jgi:hypothetical protein
MVSGIGARLAAITAAGLLITTTLASAAVAGVTPAAGRSGVVSGVSSLNSITCPTARACAALGTDSDGNGKSAIINAASGSVKVWSGKLVNTDLSAVACPSRTSCVAVSGDAVATLKVSTGALKITATLKPPPNGIVAMNYIGCTSGSCYAVGFQGTERAGQAIVVHTSAAGKVLSRTVVTGTGLGPIACPSSNHCLVGDDVNKVEQIRVLNKGKLGQSHAVPAHTYIQSLACYQAKACWALGGLTTSPEVATNELFPVNPASGAIGHVVKLGKVSGDGLACPTARQCVVIGFIGTGASAKSVAVVVSSGKPGHPATLAGDSVNGVACPTGSLCYSVGLQGEHGIVDKIKV